MGGTSHTTHCPWCAETRYTLPFSLVAPPLSPLPPPPPLKDDYNRVLLKLDEGHSHDSSQDYEDYDEDESSDEEDDGPTKYINASHISVRALVFHRPIFSTLGLLKWVRFYTQRLTGLFAPHPHPAGLLGPARLHRGPDSGARHCG